MIDDIWSFLLDENNRTVLGWLGGGVITVAGAIWVVFKFIFRKPAFESERVPTVSATHGGVAAGRDIRDSKIDASGQ
jgi:hypothetical protein